MRFGVKAIALKRTGLALAGSLLIHGLTLFATAFEWPANAPERGALRAELRPPPAPVAVAQPAVRPQPKSKPKPKPRPVVAAAEVPGVVGEPPVTAETVEAETEAAVGESGEAIPLSDILPEALPEMQPEPGQQPEPPPLALAASGSIRFAIIKESLGLKIGRGEYHWEFADNGGYLLRGVSETSGLVAVFKPVRLVLESRGRLVAGGLQPESFRSRRDGSEAEEGADFDWANGQLRLLRDGSVYPLTPGAQDILSLNYQLAYIGELAAGAGLDVATARKFERQQIDALGEEEIEVPAGRFRTLHLRAMTDSTTEIWVALDHGRLPVKIRFTDKKGDSYEQVAIDFDF